MTVEVSSSEVEDFRRFQLPCTAGASFVSFQKKRALFWEPLEGLATKDHSTFGSIVVPLVFESSDMSSASDVCNLGDKAAMERMQRLKLRNHNVVACKT